MLFLYILTLKLNKLKLFRHIRIITEAAFLIFDVIGEVAFKPFDMAVAFIGEDVCGDAVKEESIMGDDYGAARKLLQRYFERGERFAVQIIGWFIEQEQVGRTREHLGEVHAVTLPAR